MTVEVLQFVRSFVRSFVGSFVRSWVGWFVRDSGAVRSFVRCGSLFVCLFVRSFTLVVARGHTKIRTARYGCLCGV